jgi:hemolysin activation/secretion protein
LKSQFFALGVLALSPAAFAQQPPTGGGQLQQIPPAPVPERSAPEIRVEKRGAPGVPAGDQTKVVVNSLRITGAKVYSEAVLLALTGFKPGAELSLVELRAMASKVADHYHRNGYFVAKAYLPAQDIKDGVVTFAVVEGEYGKVTVRNQTNLSNGLANGLVEGLNAGDTIAIAPLESRLLLLSDIPGVNVRSTLVPGASVGTSDLIVDVTPGQRVTGSLELDNAGNRYTGAWRVGGTVNLNNPTGHGDVASLRVLTSGEGLTYGRASYQTQLGKATVGVAYTALEYRLGKEFESLDAHGTAQIASVYGSYPLTRSRNSNLYVVGGIDAKTFEDKVDATSTVTERQVRVGMIGFYGNERDGFGGGGFTTYSLTASGGDVDIETPAARAADALSARSNGGFGKLGFTAARFQNVTSTVSLYAGIYGQLASKNLDISEKMVLGGAYGVRAYPSGETYADQGYVATLEARLLLPKFAPRLPGQMHAIAFVDTGTATINKDPWSPGRNERTLSGAGVGLTWVDYNNFALKAYYARKVGSAVATSAPDSNGRFWLQLVKYF